MPPVSSDRSIQWLEFLRAVHAGDHLGSHLLLTSVPSLGLLLPSVPPTILCNQSLIDRLCFGVEVVHEFPGCEMLWHLFTDVDCEAEVRRSNHEPFLVDMMAVVEKCLLGPFLSIEILNPVESSSSMSSLDQPPAPWIAILHGLVGIRTS